MDLVEGEVSEDVDELIRCAGSRDVGASLGGDYDGFGIFVRPGAGSVGINWGTRGGINMDRQTHRFTAPISMTSDAVDDSYSFQRTASNLAVAMGMR